MLAIHKIYIKIVEKLHLIQKFQLKYQVYYMLIDYKPFNVTEDNQEMVIIIGIKLYLNNSYCYDDMLDQYVLFDDD